MLGLNLKMERDIPTKIELAKRAGAILYIDSHKIDGYKVGSNSPLTSNIVNLVKKNSSLVLNGFSGTTSDGYTTIGNKSVISFDGVDSYLTALNLDELNITGTQNFGVTAIVQINSTNAGYVFSRNDTGYADVRYGLLYENGIFKLVSSQVVLISSPTVSLNTWYKISIVRDSGVLYMFLNGVKVGQLSDSTSLISANNFRVGCRINGTGNSVFANMKLGALVVTKGSKATLHNGIKMMNEIEKGFGF